MPDAEFEHTWAEWMAVEGLDLEDEIALEIKDNRHRLDMHDGTHGQWHGDELGVLIVFDEGVFPLPGFLFDFYFEEKYVQTV